MFDFIKNYGSIIALLITVLGWFAAPFASTFIINFFDSRKRNQLIQQCSQNVVSIVKPLFLEGQVMSQEVLRALINSNSRKLDIDNRLITNKQVIEDLLFEIHEANYVSISQKEFTIKNIEKLLDTTTILDDEVAQELEDLRIQKAQAFRKNSMVVMMFLYLILFTVIAFILASFPKDHGELTEYLNKLHSESIVANNPVLNVILYPISFFVIIVVLLLMFNFGKHYAYRNKRK